MSKQLKQLNTKIEFKSKCDFFISSQLTDAKTVEGGFIYHNYRFKPNPINDKINRPKDFCLTKQWRSPDISKWTPRVFRAVDFFKQPIKLNVRVRFKGKTLRSRRLSRFHHTFKFGISHPVSSTLTYGSFLKKKAKQKFSIFSFSIARSMLSAKSFIKLKPMNIYHGRGVRVTRSLVFRKAGKVSAYR